MAETTRRRVACFCEKVFEVDLPTVVDLAARPEAADEVLRGEFMAVTCPACGKRLTPEFPCRFTGVPAGPLGTLDIKFLLVTQPGRGGGPSPAGGRDVAVTFRGVEGEKLAFHIAGLREGEVAVARLERALYDRIMADLANRLAAEPFKDFCEPPYVSLRRVEEDGEV
jgi:hypothetical protein